MEHDLSRNRRPCLHRLCTLHHCPVTSDPEVLRVGIPCLRIFSCGNIAFEDGMVLMAAFNGSGDMLTPTYVNLFGFWILEIPLAWFLPAHTSLQLAGVFCSVVAAQSVIVLITLYLFRTGNWGKQKI